jgi:CDP-glucose 4,6-dehydratase
VRPWQHVLEPLSGYLVLASQLLSADGGFCAGWNFGPTEDGTCCVGDLVHQFCTAWGNGSWKHTGDLNQPHEANLLQLSIKKAARELGWRPVWTLQQAVEHTAKWYRRYYNATQSSMLDACLGDIDEYSRDACTAMRHVKQPAQVAA